MNSDSTFNYKKKFCDGGKETILHREGTGSEARSAPNRTLSPAFIYYYFINTCAHSERESG